MRRRLFNLAAAISLLLAVAVGALGVRSYWRYEGIWREGGATSRSVVSFGGRLVYTMRRGFERGPLSWKYHVTAFSQITPFQSMTDPATWWERLGFSFTNQPGVSLVRGQTGRDVTLTLPHWFLVIVFSLLPAWRAIAWWRERARRAVRGFEVNRAATAG